MNESLTNRQIAFIIFGTVVGYGIMGLPKNVAEGSGTAGWFTLLISTAIISIFTYILTYLGYVHKNKTIFEYSELLVGKSITYIIIIIYIIYCFFSFTMVTRISSETIKLTILLKTPVWVLSFVFLLVAYYAVIKRLRVIARICEIYGVIIIVAYIIMHFAIFTQGKLINLKPFFVVQDLKAYIKATMGTIFSFLGIEPIVIISFNQRKNNKKIFKYTVLMTVFIGLFYILIVESCISVIGVDGIIYYKDAVLATIKRTDVKRLQFIRRLDGIFIITWIMSIFCTITIFAYTTVYLIHKFFKNTSFKLLAFIVLSIGFVVSLLPSTIGQIEKMIDYVSYCGLFTAAIMPTIFLILTKVKK